MPFRIKNIVQGVFSGESIIKDVFAGIDQIHTSSEEKEQAKALVLEKFKEYQDSLEQHISQRHTTDMESDSWLSKNVRPMVLIYLLITYSLLSIMDGNIWGLQIHHAYIELLGQWGITVMSFYFGSRGIEKVSQIVSNRKYKEK